MENHKVFFHKPNIRIPSLNQPVYRMESQPSFFFSWLKSCMFLNQPNSLGSLDVFFQTMEAICSLEIYSPEVIYTHLLSPCELIMLGF